MFISNWDEAYCMGFPDNTNEDILNEVDLFCEKINAFLKEGVPMEQWVDLLQAGCHKEKDFVRFNYEGMRWFTNSKDLGLPTKPTVVSTTATNPL